MKTTTPKQNQMWILDAFNLTKKKRQKKKKRIPNSQNNIILPSGKHNIQHQTTL